MIFSEDLHRWYCGTVGRESGVGLVNHQRMEILYAVTRHERTLSTCDRPSPTRSI